MRVDKDFKLDKATLDKATEDQRSARDSMKSVLVDKEYGVAVATNGRIMAKVPVGLDDDEPGGLIPANVWKEIVKSSTTIACIDDGEVKLVNKTGVVSYGLDTESQFPNWRPVIEKDSAGKAKARFGLNAKLLYQLAQALGTEELEVELVANGNTLRVKPLHHRDGVEGLITTMRLKDKS
jgi:hypothetical protein